LHRVKSRLACLSRYAHLRYFRASYVPVGWFTDRDAAGGGSLLDNGSHFIDLVLWLLDFPEVESVVAALERVPRLPPFAPPSDAEAASGFDVETFATVRIRLAGGATVTVEVCWALYGANETRIQLLGDEGGADFFPALYGPDAPLRTYSVVGGELITSTPALSALTNTEGQYVAGSMAQAIGSGVSVAREGQPALWDASMRRFVQALRGSGGTRPGPLATGRDALASQAVIDAAYRSAGVLLEASPEDE